MRWGRVLATLVLGASIAACGGGGGGGGGSDDGGAQTGGRTLAPDIPDLTASCASLQWSAAQADPLDGLLVTGVDTTLERALDNRDVLLNARILVGGELRGAMPVKRVSDQGQTALQVGVPAHPDQPWQGGDIDIELSFADQTCDPVTVSVTALQAPADPRQVIDDAITELDDALAQRAAMFGIASVQDLRDARDALAAGARTSFSMPELVLMAAADGLDVARTLTGDAALSGDAERLLGAMLDQVGGQGFGGGMAALHTAMAGYGVVVSDPDTLPRATIVDGESGDFITTMASGGSGACGAAIMGQPMTINSAWQLDDYMRQQAEAKAASNSMGNDALDFLGLALPVAGLIGGPAGSAAGAGVSAMIYVYKLVQDVTINTLPSKFDDIQLVLTPGPTFPEDHTEAGRADPSIDFAYATVSSNGMNLTGQAIDAVMQVFGAAKWAGGLGKQTAFVTDVRDALDDAGLNYVNNLLKDLLGNGGIDCFQVDSWTWSDIDIVDSNYTEARIIGDSVSLSDLTDRTMTLERTGQSRLVFETRDDRFGGTKGIERESITVQKIALVPEPPIHWVDTVGENHQFDIRVEPPSVALPDKAIMADIAPAGSILNGGPSYVSGNLHQVTVQTPADENNYPATVTLRRIATLPDENNSLVRTATIEIENDPDVTLTPQSRCIGRGETLELTAEVNGKSSLSSGDLDWKTFGGGDVTPGAVDEQKMTQTATYAAPSTTASVDVEVSFVDSDGDTVSDVSSIAVGSCDANVFIDGAFNVSADAGSENYRYDSDDDGPTLADLPNPAIWPSPALKWQGRAEYFQGSGSASDQLHLCTARDADENCTSYVDRNAEARAFGQMTLGADADGNVTFDMGFQGRDMCLAEDDRGDPDTPRCSEADASGGWDIRYYFNIEEPSTQQLDVTLTCDEGGDAMGVVWLMVSALRVPSDGDPTQDLLPISLQSLDPLRNGELSPEEMQEVQEQLANLFVGETVVDPCGAPSGRTEYTVDFDVPGPKDPDAADRGLVLIGLGTSAFIPEGRDKEQIRQLIQGSLDTDGNLTTGGVPSTQQLIQNMDRARPGSYSGSTRITGSISLRAVAD